MKFWRTLMCRLGRHRRLQVIQSYGAAQHIGCPSCGREMAIHHGLRACLPWDSEIAQLYTDMGYDVNVATQAWKERVRSAYNAIGEGKP